MESKAENQPYDYLEANEPAYRQLLGLDVQHTFQLLQDCRVRANLFLSFLKPAGARRVLILGVGEGIVAQELARAGLDVTGMDISPSAIELARRLAEKKGVAVSFLVGNALSLGFSAPMFDAVIDDHCFHCITAEDQPKFLAEAFRVLKPGGLYLSRALCDEPPAAALHPEARFDRGTRVLRTPGEPNRYFSDPAALQDLLAHAGFSFKHFSAPKGSSGWTMAEIAAVKG